MNAYYRLPLTPPLHFMVCVHILVERFFCADSWSALNHGVEKNDKCNPHNICLYYCTCSSVVATQV